MSVIAFSVLPSSVDSGFMPPNATSPRNAFATSAPASMAIAVPIIHLSSPVSAAASTARFAIS